MTGSYEGKRGLVLGVANKRSIAWAIAKRLADAGAELAFTYQGERIEKNVRDLAESVSSPLVVECDVRSDEDIERVFREVGETFDGGLDLLVHSVAYAAAEDLEGRCTGTSRPTTSAPRRPISCRTTRATSRARPCTWTRATTPWACRRAGLRIALRGSRIVELL